MKLISIFSILLASGLAIANPLEAASEPVLDPRDDSSTGLIARAGDDYPYKNSCNTKNDVDPWNYYKCECTSFVAWRLNNVNKVKFHNQYKGAHWGNANTWDEAAKKTKVKISKTPKKGAVAQTNKSGSGMGHVAWVKSVSKDGKKVTVEEYNYTKDKYGTRTVKKEDFQHYIHVKDL